MIAVILQNIVEPPVLLVPHNDRWVWNEKLNARHARKLAPIFQETNILLQKGKNSSVLVFIIRSQFSNLLKPVTSPIDISEVLTDIVKSGLATDIFFFQEGIYKP